MEKVLWETKRLRWVAYEAGGREILREEKLVGNDWEVDEGFDMPPAAAKRYLEYLQAKYGKGK